LRFLSGENGGETTPKNSPQKQAKTRKKGSKNKKKNSRNG